MKIYKKSFYITTNLIVLLISIIACFGISEKNIIVGMIGFVFFLVTFIYYLRFLFSPILKIDEFGIHFPLKKEFVPWGKIKYIVIYESVKSIELKSIEENKNRSYVNVPIVFDDYDDNGSRDLSLYQQELDYIDKELPSIFDCLLDFKQKKKLDIFIRIEK